MVCLKCEQEDDVHDIVKPVKYINKMHSLTKYFYQDMQYSGVKIPLTNVSEELTTSIIRVMIAANSEMSVIIYQTTQYNIP